MKNNILKIILIFILIILFILLNPTLNSNDIKKSKLYISEILASNTMIHKDNYQDYSDYIELYNGFNKSINLYGYHLSDSEYQTDKWTFPNIKIKPHEYLLIYASGLDECDLENRICHTNFKLSKDGEVLTLSDNVGNIINKITFGEQFPDISYGYINNKYTYLSNPTPGNINDKKELTVSAKENYKLEITEYLTNNKGSNYDKYGNYFDWMEIHNPTDKDYVLEGIYISDDINKLTKYRLPKTSIKSHDYVVVYFAGIKTNYEDGIYADFKLSNNDKYLIISNGKKIIDKLELVELLNGISYGKTKDGWAYFPTPTPGMENNTASFTKIGDENGST